MGNHDISDFYKWLESFEEIYKNKNDKPDLHSSFADAIIKRGDGIALSKQDLVEADLIIHHFVKFRKPKSWGWFPRLYIYGSEYINPWGRLISKSYALNFMEIFGYDSLDNFLLKLEEHRNDERVGYNMSFNKIGSISSYFEKEQIASLV